MRRRQVARSTSFTNSTELEDVIVIESSANEGQFVGELESFEEENTDPTGVETEDMSAGLIETSSNRSDDREDEREQDETEDETEDVVTHEVGNDMEEEVIDSLSEVPLDDWDTEVNEEELDQDERDQ